MVRGGDVVSGPKGPGNPVLTVLTFNLQRRRNNLALDPQWVSDWNATCSFVRERWLSHWGGDTRVRRVEFPAGVVTVGRWRRTWSSRVQLLSGLGEGAQAPQSDRTHMRPDVCAQALKMQLWFIDSTTWVMSAWLYQTDNKPPQCFFVGDVSPGDE